MLDTNQEKRKAEKERKVLEKKWEESRKGEGKKVGKEDRKVSIEEREEDWTRWKKVDRISKEKGELIRDLIEAIDTIEGTFIGEARREVINSLEL